MNLTIRKKLYGGFGVVLAMLVVLASVSYTLMTKAIEDVDFVTDKLYREVSLAKDINMAVVQTQQWLTDISATRAAEGYDDGLGEAAAQAKTFGEKIAELKKISPELNETLAGLATSYSGFYEMGKKMAQAYIDGGPAAGNVAMEKFDAYAEDIGGRLESLVGESEKKIHENLEGIQNDLSSNLVTTITVAIIAVFLGLGAAWTITRGISKPLNKMVDMIKDIAEGEGDLTKRLLADTNDEIGDLAKWFNKFIEKLHDIVLQVKESSENVASGSSQIASGNQDLSQRSQEQASAIEETASTIEQMTSNIKSNADNSQKANEISQKASEAAKRGGEVVQKTVTSMAEVTASSKKIGDIITVVNEIAFQTNLLALNAAVEAARAGEQGRGFAVVAGEVRNLAGRSAEAAKEIQTLINDSMEKVNAGNQLVEETGKTLDEIISGINNVAQTVSEITSASQEQASGIDQVNKAITQMDEVVQQNASLVEEAAATSENLTGEADEMQRLMGSFKVKGEEQGLAARKQTEKRPQTHTIKQEAATRAARPEIAAQKVEKPSTTEHFAEF